MSHIQLNEDVNEQKQKNEWDYERALENYKRIKNGKMTGYALLPSKKND